tara:strand:- start:18 stop:206 length:189 start_codon:yes stop_codon:yes gene_type:complete
MNTQDVIYPIGEFLEWTFDSILMPMADPLNLGILLLSLVGGIYWLYLQKKYTDKAKNDGTII